MKHQFGLNEFLLKRQRQRQPIIMDTSTLINGHLLIAGMSGTGKSYQIQKLLNSALQQNLEVDIFDVHEELNVAGSTAVKFSEATRYGYNPLVLNTDIHSGGIRKKINEIIALISKTSRSLGTKQETALRNLLSDVYYLNGCYEDNCRSWSKREITEEQRNAYIRSRQYSELRNYYPTIEDLISYADRKIKSMYLGADSKSITALERVNKQAQSLQRLTSKYKKQNLGDDEKEKLEGQLIKAKGVASDLYAEYVNAIDTGREIDDIIKYNSKDVLQTVLERIHGFNSSGIFRSNPPPFNGAAMRCYQIKSLSDDEKKLFVYNRLETIFRQRVDEGVKDDVVQIVVVDEAHKFIDDDPDNIINLIAKEGRKFGLALWCASQSPTHFSEDFLTNCGTTVLLGIHSKYWDMAARQLQVDRDVLKYIKPKEIAAVKLERQGVGGSKFINTSLNHS